MKVVNFTLIIALIISACSNTETKTKTEAELRKEVVDSMAALQTSIDQLIEQKAATDERAKESQLMLLREKMRDWVYLDANVKFTSHTPLIGANNMDNISTTIFNDSKFTLRNVEVLFYYEGYKNEFLDNYTAKLGTMEPNTNKLVEAPKGLGYHMSALIMGYKSPEIKMCYDAGLSDSKVSDKYKCE